MAKDGDPLSVQVEGHRLRLTNLDKVLYPATGTTKADVLEYYARIAPVMLPHCAGRPATRKRWPDGVGTADAPGQVFFQKNIEAGAPDWVERAEIQHSDHVNTYPLVDRDRKSTRLNSSHVASSYAVFCLKKKKRQDDVAR